MYVLQPNPVQINLVIESSIVYDLSQLTAAHQLYLSPLLHAYGQMAPRFPETPNKQSVFESIINPYLGLISYSYTFYCCRHVNQSKQTCLLMS